MKNKHQQPDSYSLKLTETDEATSMSHKGFLDFETSVCRLCCMQSYQLMIPSLVQAASIKYVYPTDKTHGTATWIHLNIY